MFRTLFRKEIYEGWRTWKTIIFLAILFISGLISPLFAKFTPALLASIPGLPPGLAEVIPAPTINDAYVQYVKNNSQFGIMLVLLLTMGVIAQEKERGTAVMLFTKPVRRSTVVLAKWLASLLTITVGVALSGTACFLYTLLLFSMPPLAPYLLLNGLMIIYLSVYMSAALFASAISKSQSMAAALAFGLLVLFLVVGALPRIGDYFPEKLMAWGSAVLAGNKMTAWPALWISLVLIAAFLAIGCIFLEREEL